MAPPRDDSPIGDGNAPLADYSKIALELAEQTSVPTLVPLLRARQRWLLMMELLLGHAPVRGGRTRDFPFSPQRRASAELTTALASASETVRPGRTDASATVTAHGVVVALHAMELAAMGRCTATGLDDEKRYTTALTALLEYLLPSGERQPFLDLFGLNHQGQERQPRAVRRYHREHLKWAREAAALAVVAPEYPRSGCRQALIRHFQLRPQTLEILDRHRLDLVFLKVKGAQSFLDTCRKPFIQRGASAWCSQVAARARDLWADGEDPPCSVLIDCDAITILAMPAECAPADPEPALRSAFLASDDPHHLSAEFVARYYPRLMPYRHAAVAEGQPTAAVLPTLGWQRRTGVSLFDLAIERAPRPEEATHAANGHTLVLSPPQSPPPAPCSGHSETPHFRDPDYAVPVWYHPSGDQKYGFAGTVFSLAEVTYARMTGPAIAALLKDHHGLVLQRPGTRRELLRLTGCSSDEIAYLKYDGDAVGRRFGDLPLLSRPALSIRLETLMRGAWLEAVAAVVRGYRLNANPADLLYLGGDDLLMSVPAPLVPAFVDAFDEALGRSSDPMAGLTFTFVAIPEQVAPVSRLGMAGKLAEGEGGAITAVNRALDETKAAFRSGGIPSPPAPGMCAIPFHGRHTRGAFLVREHHHRTDTKIPATDEL